MLARRIVVLSAVLAVTVACGSAASRGELGPNATLDVGALPPQLVLDTLLPTASTEPADAGPGDGVTTSTVSPDALVGAKSQGNRLLMIGDSVLASTSSRYSDTMCSALVRLGWRVEIDAETGRFVDFGDQVLTSRLTAGWDAAVILLGNNYRGDPIEYWKSLEALVRRLSPRQVVLLTVTEFQPDRREVNDVVRGVAAGYSNVTLLDWAAITANDGSITGADHLHLTDSGRVVLADAVAMTLGQAPESPGRCLPTVFNDDSRGSVTGGPATTAGRSTPTTVRHIPRTTTTVTDAVSSPTGAPTTDTPAT